MWTAYLFFLITDSSSCHCFCCWSLYSKQLLLVLVHPAILCLVSIASDLSKSKLTLVQLYSVVSQSSHFNEFGVLWEMLWESVLLVILPRPQQWQCHHFFVKFYWWNYTYVVYSLFCRERSLFRIAFQTSTVFKNKFHWIFANC